MKAKDDYILKNPIRIVCVGRLINAKNPINIIKAVAKIDNIELTLIGNGKLYERLIQFTRKLNLLGSKVKFIQKLNNDRLCEILKDFDIFVASNHYSGISKALIEALLVGLPCIHNKIKKFDNPELNSNSMLLVDDTEVSYRDAIQGLINNDIQRRHLGESGRKFANRKFLPKEKEQEHASVYINMLKGSALSIQHLPESAERK
ncbi:MAG: glycosyltransferase family 4 protein [Oligoflexia bacterium]|nr:glycosyltransferase family 4 protein [Oligoflexia bacterium]